MLWMWWIWTYHHGLPSQIPPSGTLVAHHKAHSNHHMRSSSRQQWEDWERRNRSRSQPRYSRHHICSHCDLNRGHSRSWQWGGHSHYRSSSRQSHSAHWQHSCRPHSETPHWTHCKSYTHCSSSGYHFHDHSRSHSQPSYRSSKHNSPHREVTKFEIILQSENPKITPWKE